MIEKEYINSTNSVDEEEKEISMDKITEENEENIFDLLNKDAGLEQFKIDESNFDEIMNKNITANNVKDYFDPCLYNTNEDKHKFKPEINQKSKKMMENKKLNLTTTNNDKSNDNLSKSRVEV